VMQRRVPLGRKAFPKQRKPLPKVREQRRRNEGRVTHGRVKRPIADDPNAAEQRHWLRLKKMGCLGCLNPVVECHHSLTAKAKRCRRDHRFVVPLCENCHRGRYGVHGTTEQQFSERIGIDLGLWSVEQWEVSCG
jgi:hypothetical protein